MWRASGAQLGSSFRPSAVICWTEAPERLRTLARQRSRWHRGLVETIFRFRTMCLNPRYGVAGLFAMPFYAVFEMAGPFIECLGYTLFLSDIALGRVNYPFAVTFFFVAVFYGTFASLLAILLEELSSHRYPKPRDILTLTAAGVLSGTPTLSGTSNFTVRVADSSGGSASKAFALTVNAATLTITTASPLPTGTVGSVYSQTLSASGGTAPYSWTVVTGSLPGGLSLGSSGVVGGSAQVAGTFNFTVQANDSASGSAQKAFSITISAVPTPVTISTGSQLPTGAAGSFYSQALSASGGTAPYSWNVVAGSLPGGLSLSTAGLISGTPQTAGAFNFTVQANDSASGSR